MNNYKNNNNNIKKEWNNVFIPLNAIIGEFTNQQYESTSYIIALGHYESFWINGTCLKPYTFDTMNYRYQLGIDLNKDYKISNIKDKSEKVVKGSELIQMIVHYYPNHNFKLFK